MSENKNKSSNQGSKKDSGVSKKRDSQSGQFGESKSQQENFRKAMEIKPKPEKPKK